MACISLVLDFVVDGDIEGKYYEIPEFPDLEIICRHKVISLCPDFFGYKVLCVHTGGIRLELYINGVAVVIGSEDSKNVAFFPDSREEKWGSLPPPISLSGEIGAVEIITKQHKYVFETVEPLYDGKYTYLVMKITQCPLEQDKQLAKMIECSFNNPTGCVFKVGDIFKIHMGVNYTTGTVLKVWTNEGLEILDVPISSYEEIGGSLDSHFFP